jgi:hypothetical protein
MNIVSRDGRAGMIVPSGISTDSFTQALFRAIVESGLASLYSFENEDFIFSNVHHSFRFSLLTLGKTANPSFAFFLRRPDDIVRTGKIFSMSSNDFDIINPNTKNCPVFRSQQDYALAKRIYSSTPVLVNDEDPVNGNHWMASFMLMFMMNTDSHLFRSAPSAGLCPLYEGKMIHQYDHRWATYEQDGSTRDVSELEKVDHDYEGISRHWVNRALVEEKLKSKQWSYKWLIGWRDVTSAHVLRTFIASVVPATAAGNNLPLLLTGKLDDNRLYAALLGNLNSLSLDFVARMKTGGNHLNFYIVKQLPVITPKTYIDSHLEFILPRVLELTYTAHDLKPWAEDLGYGGPPFIFDPERRALLRAELDAFYAHLYGLNRDELRYILDPADVMGPVYPSETFRVLKNNEMRQFGEYRTQKLVLEAWDRLFGKK